MPTARDAAHARYVGWPHASRSVQYASLSLSGTADSPSSSSLIVCWAILLCVQEGGICNGFGEDPYAQRGYFPIHRGAFVQCTPIEACLGGVNATCSPRYTGDRCAQCNIGTYRCVA